MILRRISVLNYKNIAQAEIDLSPKLNCFIGNNGEGKTNLLDAVYYLSFCKSASNPIDSQNIRHDEEFFVIQGRYDNETGGEEDIYCGLKRGLKKQFKRNKKEYRRMAEHIGLIPLVMVCPSDYQLIAGGSEERRKFMDVVISQYDHPYLESLMRYNKALMQRNVLLRQEEEPDGEMLGLWELAMAKEGAFIFQKRQEFVERFIPTFQQYYHAISQDKEQVDLVYTSHGQRGDLLKVIQEGRDKDRIVGHSLHGIHKDELQMIIDGYPVKHEGSQGQNKTYLISLKMAQFDFLKRASGTTPLLLLDDIFDKLDAGRVEQIVKIVAGEGFGQIFITDTNRDHLDQIVSGIGQPYLLFHVEGGAINPIER
jgi:DNA replication and repair protein RecF